VAYGTDEEAEPMRIETLKRAQLVAWMIGLALITVLSCSLVVLLVEESRIKAAHRAGYIEATRAALSELQSLRQFTGQHGEPYVPDHEGEPGWWIRKWANENYGITREMLEKEALP
jgi:hypothetical protein